MNTDVDIEHWDKESEGELTEQKMRRKLQDRGYSVTRYVYSPGTCFPEHSHDVDKIENDFGIRQFFSSGFDKWVPHVHEHDFDGFSLSGF